MNEEIWTRWVIQTARSWPDIANVVKQTGIESIDQEHRGLIESALDLNRLIELFESNEISLDILKKEAVFLERLREVTDTHFQHEEQLIGCYQLRNLSRQQAQHRQFITVLDTFIQDFNAGRMWVSLNLKMSVLEWVVNHINQVDYDTFCVDAWMPRVLESALTWDELEALIKPTGLHRLDEEHKDLVVLTLELNRWIDAPHDRYDQTLLPILERISSYAVHHFQHEEGFIARQGLPTGADQHQNHLQFMELLESLRRQVRTGSPVPPRRIKQEILNWWVNHINLLDYNTFRLDAWVGGHLGASSSWENLSELVKTTGVDQLDQEHQDLILLTLEANDIVEAFQKGRLSPGMKERALEILNHLKEYSLHHFEGEEAMIQRHGIPGLERQQRAHRYFLDFMDDLIRDISSGRMVFSARVKTRIISWWTGHINTVDFQTFRLDNWATAIFTKAERMEDITPLIKQMDLPWADRDHSHVVELALELNRERRSAVPDGTVSPRVVTLMDEIVNFSTQHFQREEAFLRHLGYSGLHAHEDKHALFLREVKRMREEPTIQSVAGVHRFQTQLLHWWLNHINGVDYHDFRALADLPAAATWMPEPTHGDGGRS
ncbi:MAG: hemerythrin family protein [Magnetococcales bacterium]|nr:hemerythrin family protein [Magnetococcales bacterium]MBF0150517.1 hemerythrin family protein [Magnetococcales bacterium]